MDMNKLNRPGVTLPVCRRGLTHTIAEWRKVTRDTTYQRHDSLLVRGTDQFTTGILWNVLPYSESVNVRFVDYLKQTTLTKEEAAVLESIQC